MSPEITGKHMESDRKTSLSDAVGMPMDEFRRLAADRAGAAIEWLVRSICATGGNGSATLYSRWYRPLRGWGAGYPETTGYIIPTLLEYARLFNRPDLVDLAIRQARWIVSLQYDNGALPGGDMEGGTRKPPSVFNTAQMLLGLVAAGRETREDQFLAAAVRAARWLAATQDPDAGTWAQHAYFQGFSPAYYTHVAWPMLEVWSESGEAAIREAAIRALDTIAGWQLENGAIRSWGFGPDRPAFTHTIGYTLWGFLESGRILGPEGSQYVDLAIRSASAFLQEFATHGRLAGAYDLDLRGRYWYTCLTGNCQIASVWMRTGEILADHRYAVAAIRALSFVIDRQRMSSLDPNVRGAIAGSSPRWGRYLTLRYPNWAAKFYVDALLMARRLA